MSQGVGLRVYRGVFRVSGFLASGLGVLGFPLVSVVVPFWGHLLGSLI